MAPPLSNQSRGPGGDSDLTDQIYPPAAAKSLFPPELHAALDGDDGPGGASAAAKRRGKKKTMTLSNVTALRTAEEIFNMPNINGGGLDAADKENHKKVLEALEQLDDAGGGDDELDLDDEEGFEEMDEEYDDEDGGGDYDAEGYFDNGDDDDMDDDGGDEGVY